MYATSQYHQQHNHNSMGFGYNADKAFTPLMQGLCTMQVPAEAVKSASQQVNEATSSAVQTVQDVSGSLLDGINQAVPGLQSSVESAASTVSSQVLSALAAVNSPQALNVLILLAHVHSPRGFTTSMCCSLQAAHCNAQRQPHQKMCVDSTRGRGVTGWRCMHYSCYTGQCVQEGHASSYAQLLKAAIQHGLFLSPQSPLPLLLVLRQFPLIDVHGIYCPMQLLKACQRLSSQQSQEPCSAAAALHLAIQNLRSTNKCRLQGLSYIACCASHWHHVFPDGHLASPAAEQFHSALCSKQVLDYLCTSVTEVPLHQRH